MGETGKPPLWAQGAHPKRLFRNTWTRPYCALGLCEVAIGGHLGIAEMCTLRPAASRTNRGGRFPSLRPSGPVPAKHRPPRAEA